jgi:DHA1 family tetracycline resistance protein-like MFS transporter
VGIAALPVAPVVAPLLGVFAVIAVGQGISSPALQSLVSRGVAGEEQGEILGSNQSMSALARAIGPACGGWLFDHVGRGTPFWFAGVLLVGASALSLPAGRRAQAAREA